MTLAEHTARMIAGTRLRCTDHWIASRIGCEAEIIRAGSTVQDWRMDGKPYRSPHAKASEMVRCDEYGYRVETVKPDGTPMFWEWELIPAGIDVCADCGQTLLTTPDDPMPALWCDTCTGGVK